MAKPAKKKSQTEVQPAKGGKKPMAKAVAKGKGNGKTAAVKPKKQAEPQGLKARLTRSQAVKTKPSKGAAKGAGEKRGAGKFLREVKVELSKVTWPSRDELIQSTVVVLIAVAIAGVYIFVFDEIFSRLIEYVASITG